MNNNFESWIGNAVTREDVVTQRLMDEYRSTLSPHVFKPRADNECPPGLHWCLALPAHDFTKLGPDGAEAKGVFLPPIPLPRRMWAGGKVETFLPLCLNDKIEKTSTITNVKNRDGKAGALCIVSVTHEVMANGALAIRERHDILFREASREPPSARPPAVAPAGDLEWQVDATPLLLFRFSAVTFNGHRIHYDLPYAQGEEGYGGLLVHGPMQAALTLNQLSVLQGSVPRNFEYRCVSPLVAGQTFKVLSTRQGVAVIANAAGVLTIEAQGHE